MAKLMDESRKQELIRKIVQVCASCTHGKGQGRTMICDRKKNLCHSKRVRRWLDEMKTLDGKSHDRHGKARDTVGRGLKS